MEYSFDIHKLFQDTITIWDAEAIKKFTNVKSRGGNHAVVNHLADVFSSMGVASAKAQGLPTVITSFEKLTLSDHRLYLFSSGSTVDGFIKVGKKKLFITNECGILKEITPLCVLDFYVYETKQRIGIGRRLFEFMLENEDIKPEKIAYDRPSPKLLNFLQKYYGLKSYIPQSNNFVVFKKYFTPELDSSLGPEPPKRMSSRTYSKLRVASPQRAASAGGSLESPSKNTLSYANTTNNNNADTITTISPIKLSDWRSTGKPPGFKNETSPSNPLSVKPVLLEPLPLSPNTKALLEYKPTPQRYRHTPIASRNPILGAEEAEEEPEISSPRNRRVSSVYRQQFLNRGSLF